MDRDKEKGTSNPKIELFTLLGTADFLKWNPSWGQSGWTKGECGTRKQAGGKKQPAGSTLGQ